MKKIFTLILVSLFLTLGTFAQEPENKEESDFEIPHVNHVTEGVGGNFNFTNIGDQFLLGARLKPELSFGKLGFGLDIPIMFDLNSGKIRIDEFTDGVGFLRVIKYVRWGVKKHDNVYFRIGELRDAQLGFGILLADYNNSISFEKRKMGFEFDLVFKDKFGLEMMYTDFNLKSFSMLALRPYYKPLGGTAIPILKTFEIGVGFVTDYDKSTLTQNDSVTYRSNYFLDKGINSFSADMGLYIFNWNFLRWSFYAQAAYIPKIKSDTLQSYITSINQIHTNEYTSGYGSAVGTDFKFKFIGNLLKVNFRAERFWNSDYFISRLYNFSYELNKDNRILGLINSHHESGMYFKLGASVLDKVIFHTNILFEDVIDETHPAEMFVGLDLSNCFKNITFYTSMHQAHVTNFADIFEFSDETMFETLLAWTFFTVPVVNLQFTAGVDFKWTYAFLATGNFEATHYLSPFFSINLPLAKKEGENH